MSRLMKPGDIGIIVAADFPAERTPDLEARLVEPVRLVFAYKKRQKEPFELPVRDLSAIEIVAVVNKGLQERKIEFGFRPIGLPSSPFGVEQ